MPPVIKTVETTLSATINAKELEALLAAKLLGLPAADPERTTLSFNRDSVTNVTSVTVRYRTVHSEQLPEAGAV
jgi:hypothetical protein